MNSGKVLKSFLIFIFLFYISSFSFSQNKYYTKSKKAIKKFETAFDQYNLKNYETAKKELSEAILSDQNFVDAYILYGEIASEENHKEQAILYYLKAISIKDDYNSLMYLRLADLEKETGKYSEAIENYNKFMAFEKKKKDYYEYVNQKLEQCKFALELIRNPVDFNPINLGSNINTRISEYWPSLTADDSMIVFTASDRQTNSQEDLFFSVKKNGLWQVAEKFSNQVNSEQSEGAQTISADGKTMIFTACLRKDGYGSCDLYLSEKKGNNWSKPVNMGSPINGSSKETQPCLSSDGKTLYFVSNRPGGKGKFDIWMTRQARNKRWEQPVNLGDSINTKEDELAPFIHYDNITLYFSSEGHPGMGGSDLFISRKNKNDEWQEAKNLGYPINTFNNEESLVVSSGGDFGLISSNMEGGYGQKDIYKFFIPPQLKPFKTIFIKGIVYDAITNKKLFAEIEITSFEKKKVYETESDEVTGEFLVCLTPGISYSFHIIKPGYMFYSENYTLPDSSINIKIPLQPIETGKMATLKNIFFRFDSYELEEESFPELDKIVQFIRINKLTVEIQGHTDSQGKEAYNQKLSENRARAVYEYLIKSGADKKRLSYKGFGFSQPVASNETKEGQSLNRRTLIKIISKE